MFGMHKTASRPGTNLAKRRRGTVALVLGIAILAVLAAAMFVWFSMERVYSDGSPPVALPTTATDEAASGNAFPANGTVPIDWAHWHRINPAIIAWITIPGTPVNYPVVDAPADDSSFYLTHDVQGRLNCFGCIYRDPDCTSDDTRNTVLYGHNMGWSNAMFGSLASYTDPVFAREHRRVIIRTPTETRTYRACAATVVNGLDAHKHVSFTDRTDFERWWKRTYQDADIKLSDNPPPTNRLLTLCTCSYHFWDNERTLVYAVEENTVES
jgi:sortase B